MTRIRLLPLFAAWLALSVVWNGLIGADEPPVTPPEDEQESLDETIHNEQPPFYVHAEVNKPELEYAAGDFLSIRVASEQDAYLYVQYQQADGQVFQIFPNRFQPDNRVAARQVVQIPGGDDLFRWVVGPPFGKEVIKVIASKEPLDQLSDESNKAKRFNPISTETIKGIELELGEEEPTQWAECDLEIVTRDRDVEAASRGSRRYGIFFGVSAYEFDEEAKEASGGEHGLNLGVCHRDAQTLGKTLRDLGDLSELKIYTNEQATRANLEEAVTRWLPSVSRPGDTVFIFFSGHGGQLADDNGDEKDQLDEYILPHDFVSPGILNVLIEKYEKRQLTVAQAARVEKLASLVRQSGDNAPAALVRATAVTDDLFGRWIQRLTGRQVIVILDTCHSGGFATSEKGLGSGDRNTFDFIDGEIARLKDIGEKDQAMLSAALAAEYAYERSEADLGVMTHFLVTGMRELTGPIQLEQLYKYCDENMAAYYEQWRLDAEAEGEEPPPPAHPHLINLCTHPVLLKP